MANSKSATKTQKQSLKKRVFNLRRSRAMKSSVKDLLKAVADKDKAKAEAMMPTVQKALDKAAKEGIIKKNNASRKKSRLSARVAGIK
jgi:small subunit ribosomal protein S20